MGHPWQYKIEDIGNTQEGEKLDINISDIETSARVLRNTWVYTGCVMKKSTLFEPVGELCAFSSCF